MSRHFKATTLALAGTVLLALPGLVLAQTQAKTDTVWSAPAIQWQDGPVKGVKVATLWGDMSHRAPYGVLIKFEPGLMHPLHYHTESLRIVVLSGTFVHKPEGGTESQLGPGSYLLQTGGARHVSGCAVGAECQFFMTSGDAFDLNVVGSEAAPK